MDRYFEKISFEEFKKSFGDDRKLYDNYNLPKRSTLKSAGYDFFAIKKVTIKPGEIVKIPTGYKAKYPSDEMLLLIIRSNLGFKHNIRMCNQIGVIDADYYNNSGNEGHMFVSLQNEGTTDFVIEANEAYVQGIFTKYLICDNDSAEGERIGGFGSTNKKEGMNDE